MENDSLSPLAVEAAVETVEAEIDVISEQLAYHQIVSEERHEEILEGVEECRENLDQLRASLNQQQTADSPTLNLLMERVTELCAKVDLLQTQVNQLQATCSSTPPSSSPQPSQSEQPQNPQSASSGVPEVQPEAETPKVKTAERRRVQRI